MIGKAVKEGGARYAKRASDPAIFSVGDALVRAADRMALDLLDTKLLQLDPGQVERLHAQAGDKSLTLEKKGTSWSVTESPAGAFPADFEATVSMSQLFSDFRAEHFAAYGKGVDWSKYGLDKPTIHLTVGADKEHVIELGEVVQSKQSFDYARVDKGAGAAVLSPETAHLLKRTYLDYVQRDLLKFDSESVTALQRSMVAKALEVVKKDADWQMVKPVEEKADEQVMRQLFEQLGTLRRAHRWLSGQGFRRVRPRFAVGDDHDQADVRK